MSADTVRAFLAAMYGDGTDVEEPDEELGLSTTAWNRGVVTWSADELTVGLAVSETGGPAVFAHTPLAPTHRRGYQRVFTEWEALVAERVRDAAVLERQVVEAIERLAEASSRSSTRAGDLTPLLDVVRVLASPTPGPDTDFETRERDSARLLVADQLLHDELYVLFSPPNSTSTLSQLRDSVSTVGARYYCRYADECVYAGSLADSAAARSPSPPGVWGGMGAAVYLVRRCTTYEGLIPRAESLLARAVEPELRSFLHYVLGGAYESIVGASQGAAPYFASVFVPETDPTRVRAARRTAIEHYRAAITGALGTEFEDNAWRRAWRLSANLGAEAPFTCFVD